MTDVTTAQEIRPFRIDVSDDELKDLRDRLARTRCRRVWVGRRRTG